MDAGQEEVEIKCHEIKMIPLTSVILNPRNNNRHSLEQIELGVKIIKDKGFREPITISNRTGEVICGELRTICAQKLNMTEIPAVFQDFKSRAEELEHLTASNELAKMAELDRHEVKLMIEEIPEINVEMLAVKNLRIENISLQDMEDLNHNDKIDSHTLEVIFNDEDECLSLYNDLLDKGFLVKKK